MKNTKAEAIQTMFDGLAPRYDLMNRIMTLGRDRAWRRFVVDRAELSADAAVLDLAAGTGDIALEVKRRFPQARVVAADFAMEMLKLGKRRPGGKQIIWTACDAAHLPFASASFDAVTFGYLLRNVADIQGVLNEVFRVLKPGGRAVCLDTMPPPPSLVRPFIQFYLKHGLPLLGRLIAGDAAAYAYLSQSTLGFNPPQVTQGLFEKSGFTGVAFRRFMFDTIAVHWAQKES